MTSDGFSVKTTISQLGNVARTQAKGQQAGQATPGATSQLLKSEKRVDRVKRTSEATKKSVDPDGRRTRDEEEEPRDEALDATAPEEDEKDGTSDEPATDRGGRLDIKA